MKDGKRKNQTRPTVNNLLLDNRIEEIKDMIFDEERVKEYKNYMREGRTR